MTRSTDAPSARALLGRDAETAALDRFLATSARTGGACRVVGEPGIGKSALLDHAAARAAADGWQVLRGSGFEYEADLTYAGLHQLMLPAFPTLADLPAPHGGVLSTALGIEAGPPPRRLVVTTALLSWFGLLGRRGPLLLVVDDVQWLDRASALALSRVARRLSGLPVALLTAQRSGSESFLDERTDTLTLGPLDDADAARLLRSRAVPCTRRPGAASSSRPAATRSRSSSSPAR